MRNEKLAVEEINGLWEMVKMQSKLLGDFSAAAIEARARWNAARKMYNLLTGKEWHSE